MLLVEDAAAVKTWSLVDFKAGANGAVTLNNNFVDADVKMNKFTIPTDGVYNIEWALNFVMPESSSVGVQIFVNDVAYSDIDHVTTTGDTYTGRNNPGMPIEQTAYWSSIKDLKKDDVVTTKIRLIKNGATDKTKNPNAITINRCTFRVEKE